VTFGALLVLIRSMHRFRAVDSEENHVPQRFGVLQPCVSLFCHRTWTMPTVANCWSSSSTSSRKSQRPSVICRCRRPWLDSIWFALSVHARGRKSESHVVSRDVGRAQNGPLTKQRMFQFCEEKRARKANSQQKFAIVCNA